jgi:hypothetical protein
MLIYSLIYMRALPPRPGSFFVDLPVNKKPDHLPLAGDLTVRQEEELFLRN